MWSKAEFKERASHFYNLYFGKFDVWFLIMALLIFSTVLDISTMWLSPAKFGELNPIYNTLGWPVLLIINIFMVLYLPYILMNSVETPSAKSTVIFTQIAIILLLIGGHFLGAYSNVVATEYYFQHPEVYVNHMAQMDTQDKSLAYFKAIAPLYYLLFFSLICHWFYERIIKKKDIEL